MLNDSKKIICNATTFFKASYIISLRIVRSIMAHTKSLIVPTALEKCDSGYIWLPWDPLISYDLNWKSLRTPVLYYRTTDVMRANIINVHILEPYLKYIVCRCKYESIVYIITSCSKEVLFVYFMHVCINHFKYYQFDTIQADDAVH